jgi:prepilin-type N-terminal cleavage/methylation domain-containing protein
MSHTENGFTIIELLISLLVAGLILISAYQLFGVVNNDSLEVRQRAIASNIAYENLRTYSSSATNPCTVITPSPQPSVPTDSTLVAPTAIVVTITCPYGTASNISKIAIKVTYGNPQVEVNHALFTSTQ